MDEDKTVATLMPSGQVASARPARQMRRSSRRGDWWRIITLGILSFLMLFPLFLALIISFKSPGQFSRVPFLPTLPLRVENYAFAWEIVSRYMLNSIKVSGITVVAVLGIGSLSAYSFAIVDYPGRTLLFFVVLALMMVPSALTLVPSFVLVVNLGLVNTHWGLILPWVSSGQILAILLLRGFFLSLPGELFDACRIDGASEWQIYTRVALPLSGAMIGVVAVLNLLGTWNDLIWSALTITERRLLPLTPGLYTYMREHYANHGRAMAGLLLGTVPLAILFIFTSKWFVEGLTSGVIKA